MIRHIASEKTNQNTFQNREFFLFCASSSAIARTAATGTASGLLEFASDGPLSSSSFRS